MGTPKAFSGVRNALWTGGFVLLLLGAVLAYGLTRFGSLGALEAALRGQVLYAEPAVVSLGELRPREQVSVPVRIRNLTGEPVKLVGSHSGCGCTVAEGLPLELGPGEVRELQIRVKAPAGGPAEMQATVTFYANVAGEGPEVVLRGHVAPADAGGGGPPASEGRPS